MTLSEQVLDKLAKELSEDACETWKERKSYANCFLMKEEDRKLERAVELALCLSQAEVLKEIDGLCKKKKIIGSKLKDKDMFAYLDGLDDLKKHLLDGTKK